MDENPLGDYLKARRELVQPADVGLRAGGFRRVAGLRREEVAMLAGISSDYYLRLEQGRDRNPSQQVLDSLARVLGLDHAAAEYLEQLARAPQRPPARARRESVPEGIRMLLETIGLPAFVENRFFEVLASNPLAEALSPNLTPGASRMRAFFLDEAERALYPEWDDAAAGLVARFRASIGTGPHDPRLVQLIGELSLESETFRRLWARHDVRVGEGTETLIRHPVVGDLRLRREKLSVSGTDHQLLVIYHAAAGSDSAGLLRLLGHEEARSRSETHTSPPTQAPRKEHRGAGPDDDGSR